MTIEKTEKKRIPLKEGLFDIEKGRLTGSKCPQCGQHFFPTRHVCLNCFHRDLEPVELSTRGKIDTYTISRMVLPGSVMKEAPYGIAHVALPEGVIVQTVLTDCDVESISIGMDVELVIRKVEEDEEGNEVMAYFFRPVKGGSS